MKIYKYIEMRVEKNSCENIKSIWTVYKEYIKSRKNKNICNVQKRIQKNMLDF